MTRDKLIGWAVVITIVGVTLSYAGYAVWQVLKVWH